MMYRDSTLNDEDLGVAIIQNNRFVELNDNYASYVSKTRKQMLGQEQDLSGMPQETIEMIDREMGLIMGLNGFQKYKTYYTLDAFERRLCNIFEDNN